MLLKISKWFMLMKEAQRKGLSEKQAANVAYACTLYLDHLKGDNREF